MLDVSFASHKVVEDFFDGIEKHAVDGEVAPKGIFLRTCGVNSCRAPSIDVAPIFAKRCHFKVFAFFDDDHNSKGNSNGDGFGKELLNVFDRSVCCNVNVIGGAFHQKVAHPPSCKIGGVTRLLQVFDDGFSVF